MTRLNRLCLESVCAGLLLKLKRKSECKVIHTGKLTGETKASTDTEGLGKGRSQDRSALKMLLEFICG